MADDDKSPLTRRRVLGGMATIGAAGAVGAGTWARFTDEERKNITVEAGRLDLQFKDVFGGEWQDGPINVDLGTFKNGQKKVHCELLRNDGTVAANELTLNVPSDGINQEENNRYEPERSAGDDTNGKGELLRFIEAAAFFVCRVSGGYKVYPCYGGDPHTISSNASSVEGLVEQDSEGQARLGDKLVYDQLGPVRLNQHLDETADVDLGGGVLAPDGEDNCLFCIAARVTEPDGYDNANIAQSDRVTAAVDVQIAQDKQSGQTSTSG